MKTASKPEKCECEEGDYSMSVVELIFIHRHILRDLVCFMSEQHARQQNASAPDIIGAGKRFRDYSMDVERLGGVPKSLRKIYKRELRGFFEDVIEALRDTQRIETPTKLERQQKSEGTKTS
jgi:hypothetical protein